MFLFYFQILYLCTIKVGTFDSQKSCWIHINDHYLYIVGWIDNLNEFDLSTRNGYHLPSCHSFHVFDPFSHSTKLSLPTCVPLSVLSSFTFLPSTSSQRCSLTVTRPARSSSAPRITANGASSFSPAANCTGSFGLFFARKSVYWRIKNVSPSDIRRVRTLIPAVLNSVTSSTRSCNNPSPALMT